MYIPNCLGWTWSEKDEEPEILPNRKIVANQDPERPMEGNIRHTEESVKQM